jgi:hypothetical protein
VIDRNQVKKATYQYFVLVIVGTFLCWASQPARAQQNIPGLVDAHIHYSHDAWEHTPPLKAISLLREAGLKKAFVSSSSDRGTQKLYALDPELIVPVLRPYRKRGELGSWMYDETVPGMLKDLLGSNYYAGIWHLSIVYFCMLIQILKRWKTYSPITRKPLCSGRIRVLRIVVK